MVLRLRFRVLEQRKMMLLLQFILLGPLTGAKYEGENSRENVYLAALPMFHIYGLSLFVMGLLSWDISVVVMWKFGINNAVTAIDRYNVTHFPLVPPIYQLESKIEDFLHILPHVDFIQGYGMTESTAVGTRGFNTWDVSEVHFDRVIGSKYASKSGRLQNWFIHASWGDRRAVASMTWCYGRYLNDRQATMISINEDGWLCTGDIGSFDDQGYVHIVDRLKDIIKYKGFQIASADLEAILLTHPDILDATVVSAADEEAGEVLAAFLVKKPGSMLSGDAVIQYVTKQVAPYKKVRKAVFVALIPKSAVGKVLRRQLRNLLSSKL
ncbi:hypothetical protein Dimus_008196 [Dionaea muscipula]